MSFWEEKLAEYQEALDAEKQMEYKNDDMIQYLKFCIDKCIKELS